jgi:chromosome segregation protein
MSIDGLLIDGFKSFADRVKVPIGPGMTGIVGPNGCGKSNFVEAVKWAMGDHRVAEFRGSGMEDVIFGGTQRRSERNICEVALEHDAPEREGGRLTVRRRIERGQGSSYWFNDRKVRLSDVTLHYKDIGSGPTSAALVSQSQITRLVDKATPADRRPLLEAAAGIAGLKPRRDAAAKSLRESLENLRNNERDLERLSVDVERLAAEAEQARRRTEIDGLVRRAEATVLHVRHRSAAERLSAATARHDAAEKEIADAMASLAGSEKARLAAAEAVPPVRERRLSAESALARASVHAEQIANDAERRKREREELARRVADVDADVAREAAVETECAEALEGLADERAVIVEAQADESAEIEEASERFEVAGETAEAAGEEVERLVALQAQSDARRAEARRRVEEVGSRARAAAQRLASVREILSTLTARAEELDPAAAEENAALRAEDVETAAEALDAAASETERLREAEETARTALAEAGDVLARIRGEAEGVALALAALGSDPDAVASRVDVDGGYEKALAGALGSDLAVGTDPHAPATWTGQAVHGPGHPAGTRPLSDHVRGVPELSGRLAAVGVVGSREEADSVASRLQPGQRVVSPDGYMRRWDGFRADLGDDASARRLSLEARRRVLDVELQTAVRTSAAAGAGLEDVRSRSVHAKAALEAARRADAGARIALEAARRAALDVVRLRGEVDARIAAARDEAVRFEMEDAAARSEHEEALATLATFPPAELLRSDLEKARGTQQTARRTADEAKRSLDNLMAAQRTRRERGLAIVREVDALNRRILASRERRSDLAARRTAAVEALATVDQGPAPAGAIEEAREAVELAREEVARVQRDLDEVERTNAEAERLVRETAALVDRLKEDRSGRIAEIATAGQQLKDAVERVQERFEGRVDELAGIAGLDPAAPLPAIGASESRLSKLIQERDGLGAVNMLAAQQLAEATAARATIDKSRAEVALSVQKLELEVAALDREGRTRMEKAFGEIDGRFRDLFVRLFRGGQAFLKLVDNPDPFAVGIEVFAAPPGKKMQMLSLYSGGEKSLIALCLIFATFLVKPGPICVLDEVDAAMDDANVDRMCGLIEELARDRKTRFVVVTHKAMTMSRMDRLYGVTMAEQGVSRLAAIDLNRAIEFAKTEEPKRA